MTLTDTDGAFFADTGAPSGGGTTPVSATQLTMPEHSIRNADLST